jgi:hypothetical protein
MKKPTQGPNKSWPIDAGNYPESGYKLFWRSFFETSIRSRAIPDIDKLYFPQRKLERNLALTTGQWP